MNKDEEIPLRKAFQLNKWSGWEENELLFSNIEHKQKGNLHLYNYGKNTLVDRNNPVIMKCRGLVVDDEGKVLNYPFERFFNDFEKEKTEIDWSTAEAQEKLDGSLVNIFWTNNKWQVTTRGSFYDGKEENFDTWFKKLFNKFDKLDKKYCYFFELCCQSNRIITFYKEEFITLLGARNLQTLEEKR